MNRCPMTDTQTSNQELSLAAGVFTVFLCIIFGSNAVAIKLAFSGLGVFTTAAIRFAIAASVIFLWARFTGRTIALKKGQIHQVLIAAALSADPLVVALTAFAAFAGHCFPVFFGFRGGKGVATALAASLAFDWVIGLILIAIWLLFARVFKISSLAAIISFCALPALTFWRYPDISVTAVFAAISIILIWRHRANIQRLISGTENL